MALKMCSLIITLLSRCWGGPPLQDMYAYHVYVLDQEKKKKKALGEISPYSRIYENYYKNAFKRLKTQRPSVAQRGW